MDGPSPECDRRAHPVSRRDRVEIRRLLLEAISLEGAERRFGGPGVVGLPPRQNARWYMDPRPVEREGR